MGGGSTAAVVLRAAVYREVPAAALKRLTKLNISTMPSSLMRSVKPMERAMRISVNMVMGRFPALRPRLPSREPVKLPSRGLASTKHGIWKAPVGDTFEGTVGKPQALVGVAGATALGRSVEVLKLKFWSVAVTILNGRPELNSMIGARVQSLNTLPQKPSPAFSL